MIKNQVFDYIWIMLDLMSNYINNFFILQYTVRLEDADFLLS